MKCIVCATRGGEGSRAAQMAAIRQARRTGKPLVFLYVTDPYSMGDVDELNSHIGLLLCENMPDGVRALLVHAKDEAARNWYLQWEFEPSVTDPLHLYLLMKDLKAMVPSSA